MLGWPMESKSVRINIRQRYVEPHIWPVLVPDFFIHQIRLILNLSLPILHSMITWRFTWRLLFVWAYGYFWWCGLRGKIGKIDESSGPCRCQIMRLRMDFCTRSWLLLDIGMDHLVILRSILNWRAMRVPQVRETFYWPMSPSIELAGCNKSHLVVNCELIFELKDGVYRFVVS